jgi:hypothetical protein
LDFEDLIVKEDEFVEVALKAAKQVLTGSLSIERGASLLYQVTVDNRLEITVKPKEPKRGQSAFQTDLCVFDEVKKGIRLPRVVLEFKTGLSTHDVLTYSSKARKHKQVYPYLRYGLVIANDKNLPGRFFTHNEALDFGVAAGAYRRNRLQELFATLLKLEVQASRQLERIIYGKEAVQLYRTGVEANAGDGKVT